MKTLLTTTILVLAGLPAWADLTITPYNPDQDSLFAVTSSIIEGPTEVILVDAQFEKDDAQHLVDMIKATGKDLTTVFISHKDPDYYFGVDAVRAAFPDVKIVATPATVEGIEDTIQIKYDFWGPILEDNAPTELIVPEVFEGDRLSVDGEDVKIIGLDGHDPAHTFLWVPSEETVLGGVILYENQHVWMADNATPESRDSWRQTLEQVSALNPTRIIPGHYNGTSAEDMTALNHTLSYMAAFEKC